MTRRAATPADNPSGKPVVVVLGATSKWQSEGANTLLAHGKPVGDSDLPASARWGVGGAIAQKFAREGFFVVLTTRSAANTRDLEQEILSRNGIATTVELDLTSAESIAQAFATIRQTAGEPEVLVFNAGYLEGRTLPRDRELLEHIPLELFDTALHIACRGPFLVMKEVLPGMRERGSGSIFFSNNKFSLRGRKRQTGESIYYPRVLLRTLAQLLTEEYSAYGVHIANVVIDGPIDSPGTRALPAVQDNPRHLLDPAKIADAFWYLHTQDKSCWSHEIQLTPFVAAPSF